jgi:hypothetical protein
MTDRELVEAILSDPYRREAAHQLACEMMREQERGNANGRYEVTVVGDAISTSVYQVRQRTNLALRKTTP